MSTAVENYNDAVQSYYAGTLDADSLLAAANEVRTEFGMALATSIDDLPEFQQESASANSPIPSAQAMQQVAAQAIIIKQKEMGWARKALFGAAGLIVLACIIGIVGIVNIPSRIAPTQANAGASPVIDVAAQIANNAARATNSAVQIANIAIQATNSAAQIANIAAQATPIATQTPANQKQYVTFSEITRSRQDLTDAQWRGYIEKTQGKFADYWTGWVDNVENTGGYQVMVYMHGPNDLIPDVSLTVDKTTALSLSQGQQILFSGRIQTVNDIPGVLVTIGEVTLK